MARKIKKSKTHWSVILISFVALVAILLASYNGQKIKEITLGMLGIKYEDTPACASAGIRVEGSKGVKVIDNEVYGFDCALDAKQSEVLAKGNLFKK